MNALKGILEFFSSYIVMVGLIFIVHYISKRKIKQFSIVICAFAFLMIGTNPAWAVQSHGGVEGLVSHQIGHILFLIGLGYLLFHLYQIQKKDPGWLEFKIFLWLIIAWNVVTFSGHLINEFVAPEKFVKDSGTVVAYYIEDFTDVIFYLTRLDHLLLVPSLVFLLLALRKWRMLE
ncbi:MAG: hypothetical protein GY714_11930 [Desulfobacterales bacterium]|nr:hypothetical protein [Desulfobacterales bacterium]MCP4160311.1 hypothetical protein [Deltaproteobacteria bacterium]